MFRLIIFIFTLLITALSLNIANAAMITEFIHVGDSIAMTGSNNDVRFDVRTALIWFDAGAPALDTTTSIPTFTGAFYGSGIGWIVFESGSNSTSLDCWGQYLTGLTVDCKLTGTGWNENIGDIGFSGVVYDPDTWKLIGKATSFAGDIDLTDIALPLKWVTINETSFVANDNSIMSVSGAWLYEWTGAGNDWEFYYQQIVGGPRVDPGVHWVSNTIDFSLASEYVVEITDPSGNITKISGINIIPGDISTNYIWWLYAESFCLGQPAAGDCPDGDRSIVRTATTLETIIPWSIVGDGVNSYTVTPKARDKYGNKVTVGDFNIIYSTTVNNIQTNDNTNYSMPLCSDAINISGTFIDACWTWKSPTANTDISYSISSTAPTNTDNKISLQSIEYNSGALPIPLALPSPSIDFSPLFSANVPYNPIPPVISKPYGFSIDVTSAPTTTTIIPYFITTLKIGDSSYSEWKTLSSDPIIECINYQWATASNNLCAWNIVLDEKASIATKTTSSFILTGTYLGLLGVLNPPLEETTIKTYVYYNNWGKEILYNTYSGDTAPATRPTQRMQIFGQINKFLGLIGWENRIDLINTIKKNATLLSRNRTSYTDTDYLIQSGNITITETIFNTKRTIVAVGGNVLIGTGVTYKNHPLAIIALADSNGVGWNITISGSVRDIHASLIAEHAITSEISDNQLYIHGLVSSANSPQEMPPPSGTCPYFVTTCTDSTYYDLPYSRSGMLLKNPVTSYLSQSGSMFTPPLVIEIDTRLTRDPPKFILK